MQNRSQKKCMIEYGEARKGLYEKGELLPRRPGLLKTSSGASDGGYPRQEGGFLRGHLHQLEEIG